MRLRLVVPVGVEEPTGGNRYDLALAAALRDGGDEVRVCPCEPHQLAGVLRQPGPDRTLIDGLVACSQPHALAASRAGVLVHMPLALEGGLAAGRAAELASLERQALHHAAVVIATSHWSAAYLAGQHGLDRVAVAPPGTRPAPLVPGSQPPLLLHLAALLPHKDQLGVVTALSRLRDLPWQAVLAGPADRDPDYAAAVRRAVREHGLTARVDLPGLVDGDGAWAGVDLALLPSRTETFGMVVTEAMAHGIPALVSEGGAAEALGVAPSGDRPGMVVPAGDTDALTEALRRWLTDPHHRDVLRAAALARRATLTGWDVTARLVRAALSG